MMFPPGGSKNVRSQQLLLNVLMPSPRFYDYPCQRKNIEAMYSEFDKRAMAY